MVMDEITEEQISAPAHQPAEVLSALARLVRAGELDTAIAAEALREAADLPQALVTPSLAHLERALHLQDRVRVLDGLYVALAEELGCPLVTTDRRLADAGPPCEVRAPG
jgi:predicted nucleic acid-binding protein